MRYIYPLVPFVLFVFLVAAVSNYGKLKLSETPEIEGSNSATWTNSADSTWISKGPITTGNDISDFAATSGINFVQPGAIADSIDITGITIRDVSTTDRSLCFINLFSDSTLRGSAEDSLVFLISVDTNATGDNIFIVSFEQSAAITGDSLWYNYFIIE